MTQYDSSEIDLVLEATERLSHHLTAAIVSNDIQFVNYVSLHDLSIIGLYILIQGICHFGSSSATILDYLIKNRMIGNILFKVLYKHKFALCFDLFHKSEYQVTNLLIGMTPLYVKKID